MAKRKRKLTAPEKAEKKRRGREYMEAEDEGHSQQTDADESEWPGDAPF